MTGVTCCVIRKQGRKHKQRRAACAATVWRALVVYYRRRCVAGVMSVEASREATADSDEV